MKKILLKHAAVACFVIMAAALSSCDKENNPNNPDGNGKLQTGKNFNK